MPATTPAARDALRAVPRAARIASCVAARTCATPRTAGAIGSRRAAPIHRTRRPATSGSAARATTRLGRAGLGLTRRLVPPELRGGDVSARPRVGRCARGDAFVREMVVEVGQLHRTGQ